jgi:two-component system, NtrC family, nitrogen regulation response regulator NtrX
MPGRATATILVIDDDQGIRDMIDDTLSPLGYRVEHATQAEDGLELFRQKNVDLVILDVFMPGIDGLQALPKLQRIKPDSRILVISGGGTIRWKNALTIAAKLQATGTLAKPFTPDELTRKVAEILNTPTPSPPRK